MKKNILAALCCITHLLTVGASAKEAESSATAEMSAAAQSAAVPQSPPEAEQKRAQASGPIGPQRNSQYSFRSMSIEVIIPVDKMMSVSDFLHAHQDGVGLLNAMITKLQLPHRPFAKYCCPLSVFENLFIGHSEPAFVAKRAAMMHYIVFAALKQKIGIDRHQVPLQTYLDMRPGTLEAALKTAGITNVTYPPTAILVKRVFPAVDVFDQRYLTSPQLTLSTFRPLKASSA